MNVKLSLRTTAAACVLAASLLSSVQMLKLSFQSHSPDGDNLYLSRFDDLKNLLPQHGVVCYTPSPDESFDAKKHYFLAQYALAPRVVRPATDCDLMIQDLSPGSSPAAVSSPQFVVLKDFGNGLFLLRRTSAR